MNPCLISHRGNLLKTKGRSTKGQGKIVTAFDEGPIGAKPRTYAKVTRHIISQREILWGDEPFEGSAVTHDGFDDEGSPWVLATMDALGK